MIALTKERGHGKMSGSELKEEEEEKKKNSSGLDSRTVGRTVERTDQNLEI